MSRAKACRQVTSSPRKSQVKHCPRYCPFFRSEMHSLQRWSTSCAIAAILLASEFGTAGRCQAQEVHPGKDLPLVWVLSTGGTISGKGASSTSLTEYKAGSLLGEELVKAVPEIQQYARVRVEQIVNVGSPDITIENWITLANRINRIFTDD